MTKTTTKAVEIDEFIKKCKNDNVIKMFVNDWYSPAVLANNTYFKDYCDQVWRNTDGDTVSLEEYQKDNEDIITERIKCEVKNMKRYKNEIKGIKRMYGGYLTNFSDTEVEEEPAYF